MLLRQNLDPMRQNEQVASLENRTGLPAVPLGLLYKLEHVVHVKPLIRFHLEFFLDLANDANKV